MTIPSSQNDPKSQDMIAYREFMNSKFEPHFRISLPEKWQFGYTPFLEEKTHWISMDGPWDETAGRLTTISLMVKERNIPHMAMNELAQQTIHEKMPADCSVEFIRPTSISGLEAREIHTRCKSMHQVINPEGYDKHQWVVLRSGNYVITIHYSASEKYFDEYFEVYTKAIDTFALLT